MEILLKAAEEASQEFFKDNAGTTRTVLFENWENGFISGLTDNYIRVSCPCPEEKKDKLLGTFAPVHLKEVRGEGMIGEISIAPKPDLF